MKRSFSFHPEAEIELNQAIDYYESVEVSLGYDFALEVHAAIQRILDFPKAWAALDTDIRRSLVNRFPFGILYSEDGRVTFILLPLCTYTAIQIIGTSGVKQK